MYIKYGCEKAKQRGNNNEEKEAGLREGGADVLFFEENAIKTERSSLRNAEVKKSCNKGRK